MTDRKHTMIQIPDGKSIQEMMPAFSDVKQWIAPVARQTSGLTCACCGKLFTTTRRSTLTLRLYPAISPVPIAYEYPICRTCEDRYREGGVKRDHVLAAVQNFMIGRS